MEDNITGLVEQFEAGDISRRGLIAGLATLTGVAAGLGTVLASAEAGAQTDPPWLKPLVERLANTHSTAEGSGAITVHSRNEVWSGEGTQAADQHYQWLFEDRPNHPSFVTDPRAALTRPEGPNNDHEGVDPTYWPGRDLQTILNRAKDRKILDSDGSPSKLIYRVLKKKIHVEQHRLLTEFATYLKGDSDMRDKIPEPGDLYHEKVEAFLDPNSPNTDHEWW